MLKKTIKLFPLLLITIFISSCSSESKQITFSESIEQAHELEKFRSHEAIAFNIQLSFGGKQILDGKMTLLTNSSAGLIEENNGKKLYFLEDKIYFDSTKMSLDAARFSAYTWSYFFLFPYKLNDEGTNWHDYADKNLNGVEYLVEQLTFNAGTGDAPDDWYIAYADKETKRLHTAAYIVTAHADLKEAEEDPHAISYSNYTEIEGIPIAQKWIFSTWRKNEGLTEQLGEADLSDFEFVEVPDDFFKAPSHFMEN